MAEETGPTSIAARIAALKLEQVARAHGGPRPPNRKSTAVNVTPSQEVSSSRPQPQHRQQSVNLPPLNTHANATRGEVGNQPADSRTNGHEAHSTQSGKPPVPRKSAKSPAPPLPPRRPSGPTPQLPPRRPSTMSLEASGGPEYGANRRTSTSSTVSALFTTSNKTGASPATTSSGSHFSIKAPEYDASKLPPLPPKREKSGTSDIRVPLQTNRSSPSILPVSVSIPQQPSIASTAQYVPIKPSQPARPNPSVLTMGFNNPVETISPARSSDTIGVSAQADSSPPPIPRASRPDLTQLLASKPKAGVAAACKSTETPGLCLKCRDFSAVDSHAARYPRQSIPSTDLGWLAHQLTSPFPAATDKARAIFTWLHHNIDYDTVALYSNNVKPSTPASTIATGLAVCEGYAGLFTALATKCGLESVVVGGHGKGLGYSQPGPGASLPPYDPGGHAWNAVKIDNGKWKLMDPCWGAGAVGGAGQPYKRGFSPHHFTRDNTDFGLSHYPSDKRHFYREDGRPSISWEEYILGPSKGIEPPQMFNGFTSEEGIAVESFQPLGKKIAVRDTQPYIRFQFQKVCSHWQNEVHGQGKHYVYILEVGGIDGRSPRKVPFETNGMSWWADVPPRELGAPGAQVKIAAVTSFDNGDGRGVSPAEFREKDGRVAMGWGYVALYELV